MSKRLEMIEKMIAAGSADPFVFYGRAMELKSLGRLDDALEALRIDDPIGAVPVHLVCGIWGTLSLGLFATGAYGLPTPTGVDTSTVVKGLFYGGGTAQLMAQAIGSAAVVPVALSAIIFF